MRTAALSDWERRFFSWMTIDIVNVHKKVEVKCWI